LGGRLDSRVETGWGVGVLRAVCDRAVCATRPSAERPSAGADEVFWLARWRTAWRGLQDQFGKLSSVCRQFRHQTLAGVWDVMLAALNDSGKGQNSLPTIDSTTQALLSAIV